MIEVTHTKNNERAMLSIGLRGAFWETCNTFRGLKLADTSTVSGDQLRSLGQYSESIAKVLGPIVS